MENISLLYEGLRRPGEVAGRSGGAHVSADLNLRGVCDAAGMPEGDAALLEGALFSFDAGPGDLILRRSLTEAFLADFELGKQGLLGELERHMRAFAAIEHDVMEAKRLALRTPELVSQGNPTINFNHFVTSCQMFVKVYKNIRNMYVLLKKQAPENEAFTQFMEVVRDILEKRSADRVADACALFVAHLNEGVSFDVRIDLSEFMGIESLEFFNMRYVKPQKSGFIVSVVNRMTRYDEKMKDVYIEKEYSYSCTLPATDDLYAKMMLESQLKRLTRRISAMTEALIGAFRGIPGDLAYYRLAVSLIKLYEKLGLPCVFPELAANGVLADFTELYDVTLAQVSGKKPVPNDFRIDDSGRVILILGANQSGKTTFIRSFGNAVAFARCGLPVCAKHAAVAPFPAIYTHFQRYDRNIASEGQLALELESLADIVYNSPPGSIVIMNEALSSTGAGDAAGISSDLLGALSRRGSCVLFVTHLLVLPEKFVKSGRVAPGQDIPVYRTQAGANAAPTFKVLREN